MSKINKNKKGENVRYFLFLLKRKHGICPTQLKGEIFWGICSLLFSCFHDVADHIIIFHFEGVRSVMISKEKKYHSRKDTRRPV